MAARPGASCAPEIMAAKVSSTWCLAFSATSSGSARSRAAPMQWLSAVITGPTGSPPAARPPGSAAIAAPLCRTRRRVTDERRAVFLLPRRVTSMLLARAVRAGPRSRLPGIDQRKQDAARLRAAVDPGVIGRLLDDHVARPHVHH